MRHEPNKFRNHYRCPYDEFEWVDLWSCVCNDRCPVCNAEIEPYRSEELCLECGAVVDESVDGRCPTCREPIKELEELQAELAASDLLLF